MGSHRRRRRHTSSLTQAIWRPAVGDGQHEGVGVGEPERGGHLVLVLEEQLVVLAAAAIRCSSTRMVGEERGGALERGQVGVVGQQRRVGGDGAQHADVAQAAVALLEVGLEEEGDVAGGGAALGHLDLEHGQVLGAQPVAPGRAGLLEERLGHPGLAPDQPAVEEAEGDPDVLGGGAEHLGGPADRVVEVHALVPDRVPDGVGDRPDVPVAVVDEHHIEVAVGAQRAPAVAADGDQGQVPLVVAGGPFGQAGEPGIGLGGVAAAEFLALEPRFRASRRLRRSRSDASAAMAGT